MYIIVLRSRYQEHIKNKFFLLSLELWVVHVCEFVCYSHKDKYLVLSLFWLKKKNALKLIVYPVVASYCIYIDIWFIDFIENKFGIVYFDIWNFRKENFLLNILISKY